jgi:hypothetical protein
MWSILLPLMVTAAAPAARWLGCAGPQSPYFPPLQEVFVSFRMDWLSGNVITDAVPARWQKRLGMANAASAGWPILLPTAQPHSWSSVRAAVTRW